MSRCSDLPVCCVGFDLGLSCGWAVMIPQQPLSIFGCGAWDLSTTKYEGGGMRVIRMGSYLQSLFDNIEASGIGCQIVTYENVNFLAKNGARAVQMQGELRGKLMEFCERNNIPYGAMTPGEWKSSIGLKGNANKDSVREAVLDRFKESPYLHKNASQDAIDAVAIAWASSSRIGGQR